MASFRYEAIAGDGRGIRGRHSAATAAGVATALRDRGLYVVDVREVEEETPTTLSFGRAGLILAFTRTVATLLGAGLPLSRSLAAAQHTARGLMVDTVRTIRTRVDRGDALADALRDRGGFSPLYVGMVRAGERSGDLPGAFRRLADHLEREAEFRARLLSASMYPLVLTVAGSIAIVVLMLFVLPRFAEMLEGTGAQLPRSTAMVLAFGELFRRAWGVMPAIAIALLVLLAWVQASERGRLVAARVLFAVPVLGPLRRAAVSARFSRLLAILLGGGAALMSALNDAAQSIADPIARADIERVKAQVREGRPLHAAVATPTFSPLLADLAAVGEESGRLEELLLKSAEILDREVERALQRATALAEPVVIIAFGAILGFIALALLQAVYGVNAASFQ